MLEMPDPFWDEVVVKKTKTKKKKQYATASMRDIQYYIQRSERYEAKGTFSRTCFYCRRTHYLIATFEWNASNSEWVYVKPEELTEEQKEQEMTAQNEAEKINYLSRRLEDVKHDKKHALKEHFNLLDPEAPNTFDEYVKALKDGKYSFRNEAAKERANNPDYFYSWGISDYIIFRDPSVKPDKDGYKAAEKLLDAEYTKTKDVIKVLPADKGLEALNAFEAKTFH